MSARFSRVVFHYSKARKRALDSGGAHGKRHTNSGDRRDTFGSSWRPEIHSHQRRHKYREDQPSDRIARYIPASERVVVIEDVSEIRIDLPNLVRFEAQPATEGRKGITIRDLVKHSLRFTPNQIISAKCGAGKHSISAGSKYRPRGFAEHHSREYCGKSTEPVGRSYDAGGHRNSGTVRE